MIGSRWQKNLHCLSIKNTLIIGFVCFGLADFIVIVVLCFAGFICIFDICVVFVFSVYCLCLLLYFKYFMKYLINKVYSAKLFFALKYSCACDSWMGNLYIFCGIIQYILKAAIV